MFLRSFGVLSLSTSDRLAQVTRSRSINFHHVPDKTAGRGSALFNQSHPDAFSAAPVIVHMAFFFVPSVILCLVKTLKKKIVLRNPTANFYGITIKLASFSSYTVLPLVK